MEITLPKSKKRVLFFDDIKTLPIERLNEFQVQLMQDSGMGSTLFDIDKREQRTDAFLAAGQVAEAMQERDNKRMGLFLLFEKINTKSLCLSYLVQSVDGVAVECETDAQAVKLAKTLEKGGITFAQVSEIVETLKKKLQTK